jgi:hypothetical protein
MDSQLLAADSLRIGNTDQPSMWDGFQFGRPTLYHGFFEDFDYHVAANWTITLVNSSTPPLATSAPTVGGVLSMVNTGAQNDLISMQKVGHSFVPTAGSTIYFECRFQLSSATNAVAVCGLGITDTSPQSTADCLYFQKPGAATTLTFHTDTTAGGQSIDNNVGTLADATYVKVGFKVTGTSQVEYWVNDVKKGTFNSNITAVPLRPTLFVLNNTAAAQTMSVDYIMVAQTRV